MLQLLLAPENCRVKRRRKWWEGSVIGYVVWYGGTTQVWNMVVPYQYHTSPSLEIPIAMVTVVNDESHRVTTVLAMDCYDMVLLWPRNGDSLTTWRMYGTYIAAVHSNLLWYKNHTTQRTSTISKHRWFWIILFFFWHEERNGTTKYKPNLVLRSVIGTEAWFSHSYAY